MYYFLELLYADTAVENSEIATKEIMQKKIEIGNIKIKDLEQASIQDYKRKSTMA